MKGSSGFYRHALPALLYVLGIFVGGSLPHGIDTGLEFSYQDKVLHAIVFGGLVVLLARALSALAPAQRQSARLWLAVAGTVAVGGLLELWQSALPTRSAELADWLADALGALVAAFVLWRLGGERWSPEPARAPASKR